MEAENQILKAVKQSSLREWLTTVGRHHTDSYRHCLFVTGFAVAFAQASRYARGRPASADARLPAADVGKALIPLAVLDKPGNSRTRKSA